MKGTYVSKKVQRRLIPTKGHYRDMSIAQLLKRADNGDGIAKMWLRRFCAALSGWPGKDETEKQK